MRLPHLVWPALIGITLIVAALFAPTTSRSAALPSATAVFETSLAAPITSSATSMTLSSNSVRGGGTLSGYSCFTIDEGSSQAEFACGTVSGTSVTGLTRGVSPSTGTTTVATLQFSHRRGASVKITDFPIIQILKAQANGEDTYPNILKYSSHPTFSATTDIVDKKYVDDTAFSGAAVIDATSAARGVVELATGAEAAASTASGSSGALAIPGSLATSTYNSATAANRVPVTLGTGKLDSNFIATSTLFSTGVNNGLASSTAVGAFHIFDVGKQTIMLTSTGTSTLSIPSGITKLTIEGCAGGGQGGSTSASNEAGSGGGAGGCFRENIDVSATSTVQYYIGAAGARTTFGTIGSHFATASAGSNGTDPTSSSMGGAGGCSTDGDFSMCSQPGGHGSLTDGGGGGAPGGASLFGGGVSATDGSNGVACSVGTNGGYGGGGVGGGRSGGSSSGGAGCQGAIRITY